MNCQLFFIFLFIFSFSFSPVFSCSESNQQFECKIPNTGNYYVCLNQTCQSCLGNYFCHNINFLCVDGLCHHKSLFVSFNKDDFFTILVVFIASAWASASGVGGGGVLIPIFILILQSGTHDSMVYSHATMIGLSIVNLYFFLPQTHPTMKQTLINFHITSIFVPGILAGTLIGVLFNKIFPSYLLDFILIIVLTIATIRTIKKAMNSWKEENKVKQKSNIQLQVPLIQEDAEILDFDNDDNTDVSEDLSNSKKLELIYEKESKIDIKIIGYLVLLWASTILVAVLKGGPSFSIFDCGSISFFLFIGCVLFLYFLCSVLVAAANYRHFNQKILLGHKINLNEVSFTLSRVSFYPPLSFLIGIIGSMIGIGSGMLIAPILAETNLHNLSIAATSSIFVFFTASSSIFQYIFFGIGDYTYAIIFSIIGFSGGIFGQLLTNWIIKKSGRTSVILIALTVVFIFSCILMGYIGINSFIIMIMENAYFGFFPLCDT